MGHYDHRVHAGNAGDVWKHFLLLEAADCLLTPDSSLVYAESHVGRPKYALKPPGDWESGIGRIWPALSLLNSFPYFDILAELNPMEHLQSDLSSPLQIECYPGSAMLVAELAKRKRARLLAEIWDIDPAVQADWYEHPDIPVISFHSGDGFAGTMSLLKRAPPGLLLIDPPFIDPGDKIKAEKLFRRAREAGWTALCWQMIKQAPEEISSSDDVVHLADDMIHLADDGILIQDEAFEFSILFSQIGLEYKGASGCRIRAASSDEDLIDRIFSKVGAFLLIINKFIVYRSSQIDSNAK